MQKTNTIIVSDVHLGSPVSRSKELTEELKKWEYTRLILLGDIFDDLNFHRLNKEHWTFLSHIRDVSSSGKVEVVWIEGNHDVGLSEIAGHFLGIKINKKDYYWEENGIRMCAIHGHQFDRFLVRNAVVSKIASWLYLTIQRIDGPSQRISRYIKRVSKGWLRLSQKVANSAIRYAKNNEAHVIFCGHTHLAMQKESNGIRYYNSGCWTDIPSHLISIDEKGIVVHECR